ncbi:hypothetical protein CSW58_05095 [Caulobacter sp. B11]|uniref:hypothetical protein n=1 Tax=Caulobacter sp. B11 TaxID=2048899 RepID=UPI000C12AF2B|nr:hypothetical protein [Caulobacter sp. B11]PHY13529.1 hypothetical protein CSW58_05095 [Caulobacter sp. B11]
MIYFVSTRAHNYAHRVLGERPWVNRVSYARLLDKDSLPAATYIFSDFDRLGFWELERAAHVYRGLKAAGCRVLNDPARALQRLALLRRLRRDGINSFNAWPASDADLVDAFPVFLRTASAHRGNLTELLPDAASLAASLETLLREGYPLSDLIVVQYRAAPIHGDVFRKLAMFRVGEAMIPAVSVHERHWTAKYGQDGVAGEQAYLDDLQQVRTAPHAQAIRRAFEAANIDYGRADYGLVDGRPEIYEINTNPTIGRRDTPHPFAARREAQALSSDLYFKAVKALDAPAPGVLFRAQRPALLNTPEMAGGVPPYEWTP